MKGDLCPYMIIQRRRKRRMANFKAAANASLGKLVAVNFDGTLALTVGLKLSVPYYLAFNGVRG